MNSLEVTELIEREGRFECPINGNSVSPFLLIRRRHSEAIAVYDAASLLGIGRVREIETNGSKYVQWVIHRRNFIRFLREHLDAFPLLNPDRMRLYRAWCDIVDKQASVRRGMIKRIRPELHALAENFNRMKLELTQSATGQSAIDSQAWHGAKP